MRRDPDIVYTDRSGRRNPEYISLGCDELPVLRGRTPIQVYSDYMRSFRDRFSDYLGNVIVVSTTVSVKWYQDKLPCTSNLYLFGFESQMFTWKFIAGNSSWFGTMWRAKVSFIPRKQRNLEVSWYRRISVLR